MLRRSGQRRSRSARGRSFHAARLSAVCLALLCALVGAPQQFAVAAAPPSAAFFIGSDGGLYGYGRAVDGTLTSAVRIGGAQAAPSGGGVAATQAPDGRIAGLYIGNDGALYGGCQGAGVTARLTVAGLGQPGGPNSASLAGGALVFDAFMGSNRLLEVAEIHNPCTPPGPPSPVEVESPTLPLPPPGAHLTSAGLADGEFAVFFVDGGGALQALWRSATGVWTSSQLTAAGTSAPGGGVAVTPNSGAAPAAGALSLFFTEHNGRVYLAYPLPGGGLSGPPHPSPVVPPATSAPDGAALTASSGPNGTFVGYAAVGGAATVSFVTAPGSLSTPTAVTVAGFSDTGSSVGSNSNAGDGFDDVYCLTPTGRPVHIRFPAGGGQAVVVFAGAAGLVSPTAGLAAY